MSNQMERVPVYADVGALDTVVAARDEQRTDLLLRSTAPYRRFAVRVSDDGLDSFGLREGNYAVFREARWPDRECQVCLVRFGDEMTIRLLEGRNATIVTLRVSGDKIPPLELEPTEFSVMGILDGVVFEEFAQLAEVEPEAFDWGC